LIEKGGVQVYTGDGKGKTTAAIGQVLRILAYGGRVCIIQFFKPKQSGEIQLLKKSFPEQVKTYSICKKHPFFLSEKIKQAPQNMKTECVRQWKEIKVKILKNKYDLIVFDEVNIALRDGFISLKDFLIFLRQKPESQEWILTGRGASSNIIKEASLVTEMKEIKHPFRNGLKAREGFEY
jgi:cob(I)alamin adenosyltransferase